MVRDGLDSEKAERAFDVDVASVGLWILQQLDCVSSSESLETQAYSCLKHSLSFQYRTRMFKRTFTRNANVNTFCAQIIHLPYFRLSTQVHRDYHDEVTSLLPYAVFGF